MKPDFVFTSVSVTSGHPDKLCDLISDAILDRYLMQDPAARVAAECALTSGVVFLSTRVHSDANVDSAEIAREMVKSAGYLSGEFDAEKCSVMISQDRLPRYAFPRIALSEHDPADIARIPSSHSITLFGYACRQTPILMPLPVVLARRLAQCLQEAIGSSELNYLSPDGQVHVSIAYIDRQPIGIRRIDLFVTQQPGCNRSQEQLRGDLQELIIEPVITNMEMPNGLMPSIIINPEGVATGGGPTFHSGLTGRKTGIDTYGEYSRNCSAALSGKDPLRIDRIGVYAARHAAKHVVAAGLADECELLLSYAAGQIEPVSIRTHTYGSGRLDDQEISRRLSAAFDFRPGMIASSYGLQQLPHERDGFYHRLAVYGQVGREGLDLPWERLDHLENLKNH
ncbi:MAG: methionine adenosyltransferase [Candidatus Thiodiazotropha sp.]|jgi:S-adenosylmethionine synthetase